MAPLQILLAIALAGAFPAPPAKAGPVTDDEKKACETQWPGKNKVSCANMILIGVEATGTMGWSDKDYEPSLALLKHIAGKRFPDGWNAGAAFAMPAKIKMAGVNSKDKATRDAAKELHMLDWDHIFINDSFFDLAKDTNSAACILAHELGHLQLNHIKTRYALLELSKLQAWLRTKEGRPYMRKDAKEILAGYNEFVIAPLARKQEKEADIRAFRLLDNYFSSFDRRGCITLMDELKKTEHPGFVDPLHPSAQERIEYLAQLDKDTPDRAGTPVIMPVDDGATLRAIKAMNEQEADRKKVIANICPQIGIDDHGNAVTKCL